MYYSFSFLFCWEEAIEAVILPRETIEVKLSDTHGQFPFSKVVGSLLFRDGDRDNIGNVIPCYNITMKNTFLQAL
jgi:hypothetical protein